MLKAVRGPIRGRAGDKGEKGLVVMAEDYSVVPILIGLKNKNAESDIRGES